MNACMIYNFFGLGFILISTFFRMKLPEDLSQSTVLQKSLITGDSKANNNIEEGSQNELKTKKEEEEENKNKNNSNSENKLI